MAAPTAFDGGWGLFMRRPRNGTNWIEDVVKSFSKPRVASPVLPNSRPTRDEEIVCLLHDCFQRSPYSAIRQLTCDFHEGVAILRGTVPTYHTRQLAIAAAQSVDGVEVLDDRIQVSRDVRKAK